MKDMARAAEMWETKPTEQPKPEPEARSGHLYAAMESAVRPKVVCLCGSSKFPEAHMRAMMDETLAGHIVIPMGLYGHADFPSGAKAATNDGDESTQVKQMLDRLHFAKIDIADEILVVAVGGYMGSSTRREIEYAQSKGKSVRIIHPEPEPTGESALAAALAEIRSLKEFAAKQGQAISDQGVKADAYCEEIDRLKGELSDTRKILAFTVDRLAAENARLRDAMTKALAEFRNCRSEMATLTLSSALRTPVRAALEGGQP